MEGRCYTSKHPKRRTAKEMPLYVPSTSKTLGGWASALKARVEQGLQPDYTFPKLSVPRGSTIEDRRVRFLDGPTKSADVIKAMRWILRIEDFMTASEPPARTSLQPELQQTSAAANSRAALSCTSAARAAALLRSAL